MFDGLFESFTKMFQTIWDTMFHRCVYDGTKWVMKDSYSITDTRTILGERKTRKVGTVEIYNNTCLKCGMLTSKTIRHEILED